MIKQKLRFGSYIHPAQNTVQRCYILLDFVPGTNKNVFVIVVMK